MKYFIHIGVILIATVVAMLLWNLLIPSITGWAEINYWQTLGLMLLGRVITGGGLGGRIHNLKMDRERSHSLFNKMSREERREYLREHFTSTGERECE